MKYSQLGKTSLNPSELGFGCSKIASLTTKYPRTEVIRTLQQAFDQGINFFDTADIYGQGDSERLLGYALGPYRDKTFICTKAGLTLSAPQHFIRFVKPVLNPILRRLPTASQKTTTLRQQVEKQCFKPTYIQHQIENSLRRLNTDYLDLFLLHNPPQEVIRRQELFDLLNTMKSKGLIRYFGVSCRNHQDALLSLEHKEISCLQLNLDPLTIKTSQPLLEQIHEHGIGIIARECLNNKNVSTQLWHHPPDQEAIDHFNPAQLALQSVLNTEYINVALVGMGCRKHLIENLTVVN